MAYPIYSEISTPVYNNIITNGNGSNLTSLNSQLDASKLVAWIRVISGTGKGLVMVSNPDLTRMIDTVEFGGARGTTLGITAAYPGVYGTNQKPGFIGRNWNGDVVYPYLTPIGGDSVLRPSPIITGLEIKEGQDQISRQATLSIKAFSLAQCEIIQEYLMEPGHSLLVEYGWSSDTALAYLTDIDDASSIASDAADENLNQDKLHAKRVRSNGEYDSFFGFIVGGSNISDGDTFLLNVELRGMPGLPSFLQLHHTINPIVEVKDSKGNVITRSTDILPSVEPYSTSDISNRAGTNANLILGNRRYHWMFNSLPAIRQTPEVQKIVNYVNAKVTNYGWWDLINFDFPVRQDVQNYTNDTIIEKFQQKLGLLKELKVGSITVPKDKLVSENKYINFGLAMKILMANNGLQGYKIGDKKVKVEIAYNSYIGAFPGIFSTKASKLLIPGKIPNFYKYFLNPSTVNASDILKESTFIDNSIMGYDVDTVNGKQVQVRRNISFVQYKDLEPPLIDPKDAKKGRYSGHYEKGGYYGRLDALYINFDVFYNALKNSPNKSIRDVIIGMLNEMSSAVNSFWNFQIVEATLPNGDIQLRIIDENWSGRNVHNPKIFYHSGEQAVFLESNLEIKTTAEMTNQIILKRLDFTSNPNSKPLKTGGIFSDKTDKFFTGIDYVGTAGKKDAVAGKPGSPGSYAEYSGKTAAQLKAMKDAWKKTLTSVNKGSFLKRMARMLGSTSVNMIVTTYYDGPKGTGDLVYTETVRTYVGAPPTEETGAPNLKGAKWDALNKAIEAAEKAEVEAANTNIGANLSKIDVVPNPSFGRITPSALDPDAGGFTEFNKSYKIYCCDDTQIFDILNNNTFEKYIGADKTSQPLPIEYTFTILGKSGLRRGDVFNIWGIPKKYRDNGFFQITQIEQNVSGNVWKTTVTGKYRQQG
jgi:hypothetical protein